MIENLDQYYTKDEQSRMRDVTAECEFEKGECVTVKHEGKVIGAMIFLCGGSHILKAEPQPDGSEIWRVLKNG